MFGEFSNPYVRTLKERKHIINVNIHGNSAKFTNRMPFFVQSRLLRTNSIHPPKVKLFVAVNLKAALTYVSDVKMH